jgi:predicted phage terminase large subunit-like protein
LASATRHLKLLEERKRQAEPGGLIRFVRYFWDILEPSAEFKEGNALYAIALHLEAVADGRINRLLMNVSPGFMKSLLTDVFFPAWLWSACDRPDCRFVAFSYSSHLTERDNGRIRDLVKSQRFQELWGHRFKLVDEGRIKLTNDKTGWKFASSVGGVGTGERGDIVILDDPHNVKDSEYSTIRAETTRWFRESLQSRLNDLRDSAIIVIMQRVHEDDVSGVITTEYPEYEHLCLPMRYEATREYAPSTIGWKDWRTEDGELAWPERFPEDTLEPFERLPYLWAGQYQQRPEPRGGGIIKRDWWLLWDAEMSPAFDFILASLDTAYTMKQSNDPSAMTIWGVFTPDSKAAPTNMVNRYGSLNQIKRVYAEGSPAVLLMYAWEERLEFHDLMKRVVETCKKFRVDQLIIENKSVGHPIVQLIDPGNQDKLSRLYSIQHIFAGGQIFAPDRPWAETVITQVGSFPRAKHDDLTDTVSQAIRHLRDIGLLTRSAERLQEIEESKIWRGGAPKQLYPV